VKSNINSPFHLARGMQSIQPDRMAAESAEVWACDESVLKVIAKKTRIIKIRMLALFNID
jgi:hypothetical protein